MKEVFVLRHGNWNLNEDELTEEGREAAANKALALPKFQLVLASPYNRTQETAQLLSGQKPETSLLATTPQAPVEFNQRVKDERKIHPLGVAGVLFAIQEVHPALVKAGEALKSLIDKALSELEDEQSGLIVSHDGTMLSAERIISGQSFDDPLDHTFNELQGFRVNQNFDLVRTS